jgi:hypothetical protein
MKMESLERSGAVIDLGKRLVAQLELGDDVLAQWMAHVIAERMDAAEKAEPSERAAAQTACAEIILQLWNRRNSLAERLRPFKGLEPLIRTLDSLDVSGGPRFRYLPQRPPGLETVPDKTSKQLIDLAEGVDYSARALIRHLLAEAFEEASDEARPWIKAAVDANAETTVEMRIVGFLDDEAAELVEGEAKKREEMEEKIGKLEAFADLAADYAYELRVKHGLLAEDGKTAEPGPASP